MTNVKILTDMDSYYVSLRKAKVRCAILVSAPSY
jgi:hypothetical protein